jgi:hypothetical protein
MSVVVHRIVVPCERMAQVPFPHTQKLQAAVQTADFSKAAAGIPGAKIGAPTVTGVCERAR